MNNKNMEAARYQDVHLLLEDKDFTSCPHRLATGEAGLQKQKSLNFRCCQIQTKADAIKVYTPVLTTCRLTSI